MSLAQLSNGMPPLL